MATRSGNKLAKTAWNNPLSQIAARGLLIERLQGRTKIFGPVFMYFDRHDTIEAPAARL
jgi:hypothetical protein